MRNYQGYPGINSDVAKNVIEISEQINEEKNNPEPDVEKIQKLIYRQFMAGLTMNVGQYRNYKLY